MILSQFEEAVWHRRGSDCDIAKAWHHGGEIVSAPRVVLTHLKAGFTAALRPDPVMIGRWTQPALPTPVKQCRPSLTTVLAGWKLRCAKVAISARRKPFTRRNSSGLACPLVWFRPPPRSASC